MSSPRSAGPQHSGIAFMLAQIGAHAAEKFAERLAPLKLVPAHAGILRVIRQAEGMSQQALAKHLGMFPSRMVLVLDELEKTGLVERKASVSDRRVYALHLTARGREKLEAIGRVAREHQESLCAGLNATERETLAALLSKIAGEQNLVPGVHPGYRQIGGDTGKPG
jgi:DNA-binding MarR family transcriptional regulator